MRVSKEMELEINRIVRENPQLWVNKAHFIRAAVIRQLNSFKKGEIR